MTIPGVGGAPRAYQTPEEMQPVINNYFAECDAAGRPYTIPGLAYHLGFSSRQTVWDYGKRKEFADTINRARLAVENQRAEMLVDPARKNTNGVQFDLVNNFGYTNKKDVAVTGELSERIIRLPAKRSESDSGHSSGHDSDGDGVSG